MYTYPKGVAVAGGGVAVAVGGATEARGVATLAHSSDFFFSASLPTSLHGLISPEEFAASIRRCNAAYQTGPIWLANLLRFCGFVVWVVCFILYMVSMSTALLGAAFGCFGGGVIGGSLWRAHIMNKRIQALTLAVTREHAAYNSPSRRAAAADQQPISWSLTVIPLGYYNNRYNDRKCQITIQVGGPDLVAPVVVISQPGQPLPQSAQMPPPGPPPAYQPSSEQAYQPTYAQPPTYVQSATYAQQPAYGVPINQSSASGAYQPQSSAAWVEPPRKQNSAADVSSKQAAPVPAAVTCSRCGRTPPNPEDRFCSACGGQYTR